MGRAYRGFGLGVGEFCHTGIFYVHRLCELAAEGGMVILRCWLNGGRESISQAVRKFRRNDSFPGCINPSVACGPREDEFTGRFACIARHPTFVYLSPGTRFGRVAGGCRWRLSGLWSDPSWTALDGFLQMADTRRYWSLGRPTSNVKKRLTSILS